MLPGAYPFFLWNSPWPSHSDLVSSLGTTRSSFILVVQPRWALSGPRPHAVSRPPRGSPAPSLGDGNYSTWAALGAPSPPRSSSALPLV